MPEQAYTPPETKYEVHIDELMKAIRGEDFVQGNGLWRMRGEKIKEKSLLQNVPINLKGEQVYVILAEAQLTGTTTIALPSPTLWDFNIGLILYKSIVPNVSLFNKKVLGMQFYNSQSGNISISGHSQSGDIYIFGHSQSGDIYISGNSQSDNIHVSSNSRSGSISVANNSQLGDIYIKENSKSGDISIIVNSQSGNIRIGENSQTGYINIEDNTKIGYISIENNSQADYINIIEYSQTGNIWIGKKSQTSHISIDRNTKAMDIAIDGNSQTGNVALTHSLLSHIRIEQNQFALHLYDTQFLLMRISNCLLTNLDWQAGTKGELYINQSQLLHLQMTKTSLLKDSLLSFSDTQLQYGILQEVLVQGNLLLRKVSSPQVPFAWRDITEYIGEAPTDEWRKELWDNKKTLLEKQKQVFDDKAVELSKQYGTLPIFRITHSSLGKTEITGCDFTGFQFQYYNSNLLGCFITGTKLPKRNMVIYDPVTDTVLNNQSHSNALFEQKTAVYNQFKKIYENQGDVVEASIFHAQAMHWEQKLLWRQFRHDKEGFWKKVKLFFENIGFRLNWFSNNHGESWLVALVFTIGVGLLFFTASIWGLTHWGDFKTLNDHIHKLPGFMLPTHSYDYLSKDIIETTKATYPHLKVNLWHTLWDFLGRIFVGYGIFQFISAFRRHGKKGG